MKIEDVIARRADLSSYLVHLTRNRNDKTAAERLVSIIEKGSLRARMPMGMAFQSLKEKDPDHPALVGQKVVCFTETPLESLNLLTVPIDDRTIQFEPYGIAIPKRLGRKRGINPIWYLDITPGHDWLTKPFEALVAEAMKDHANFASTPISKLTPFIEQMGSGMGALGKGYRKEFWWEREWRHIGDFSLPGNFIGLCPADEISKFNELAKEKDFTARFVDPRWSLERIIGKLAGLPNDDMTLI